MCATVVILVAVVAAVTISDMAVGSGPARHFQKPESLGRSGRSGRSGDLWATERIGAVVRLRFTSGLLNNYKNDYSRALVLWCSNTLKLSYSSTRVHVYVHRRALLNCSDV